MEIMTFISGLALVLVGACLYFFRKIVIKAKSINKFQTYSKSVDMSLIESGVFTEHGIVYNPRNHKLTAQHKRSQLFYESVL